MMRYLHPVQAHERFLASGCYRFAKNGTALQKTESWAMHVHADGEKFLRVDVDARAEEGKSMLVEALVSQDDALVRLDIRYENDRFELGVKTLRATYQAAADRLQVGYSMNGGERDYIELELPPGALIDVPLLVFRGGAIRKLAAQAEGALPIYVPMFENAQLFPGVLQRIASPVEYIADDVLLLGEREIPARRYRYIDKALSYWIDQHGMIIKRVNSFKQQEIVVEISNYAPPKL
ncbi:MAG: hypothetical protein OXI34_07280 [Chloroflexota bacterium]|nr:hypothetical protein [Chloroflexota bacterium]MDE2946415.1 hypothetical protein [Chloroflexota bacterium]